MAITLTPPLLITFSDILKRVKGVVQLASLTTDEQDSVLQFIYDWLYLPADQNTPGDSQNLTDGQVRQLQINLGAWYASFIVDTPAGTGSLSGVSIDAFNISNTMAKNNSHAEDLLNANQFGTMVYELLSQRPETRIMI